MKRNEIIFGKKKITSFTPKGFSSKLIYEFLLKNTENSIELLKNWNFPLSPKFFEGLSKLTFVIDIFLDILHQSSKNNNFVIKLYQTVHLENVDILRATGDFQGQEWFSNISVIAAEDQNHYLSDEGAWYGKVCYY